MVTHPPWIINSLKIAITHTHTHTVLAEGNLLLSLTVQYILTPVSYWARQWGSNHIPLLPWPSRSILTASRWTRIWQHAEPEEEAEASSGEHGVFLWSPGSRCELIRWLLRSYCDSTARTPSELSPSLARIPLPSYVNTVYFSPSSRSKMALIIVAVSVATLSSHKDIWSPGRYKRNCNDLTLYSP